ncbi:MAG TPA: YncE family protein [Solirubrobacteraceae bacterium]|nr:YncE family protein [Solirubrobacteraceae bacterium]
MHARRVAPVLAAGLLLAAGCGVTSRKPLTVAEAPPAGCSTAIAAAQPLSVRTAVERVAAPPFGIAVTPDGRWSFVDLLSDRVAVFSDAAFTPRLVRTIKVPEQAVGSSLTRDGRYLLVADGDGGTTVVSVQKAETGARHPVLGTLTPPTNPIGGQGAIEVTPSPDGRYAFVSIEYGGGVAVYDLAAALAHHFRGSHYLGLIPLGQAVVGTAISPNGRWMYATSELARGAGPDGSLSVINLSKAERHPGKSVVATVLAHCSPVRVAVSANGAVVWVTARESDQLLGFSAGALRRDPSHALIAAVGVGEAPVGLAIVDGGRDVVVADSNRFDVSGAEPSLMVVNTSAALAQRPAVVGTIPTGNFPREMALEPNHKTLLVGDFGSEEIQAVSVVGLP